MTAPAPVAAGPPAWTFAPGRAVALDEPRLIAILNVTPDSFSDGGQHDTVEAALTFVHQAIGDGAWAIDIGAESTRPGATRVDEREQICRAIPVIEAIRASGIGAPISIDTTRAHVARVALDAGADIINDVAAGLEDDQMLQLAATRGAGVILMHRLAPPDRDSFSTDYAREPTYAAEAGGVVRIVHDFLRERARAAIDAGVDPSSIVVDPGLGFGKSVDQNWELIRCAGTLHELGYPVLSAASRKSFIGAAIGEPSPARRDAASAAITLLHASMGLRLFRVHDVEAHARTLGQVRDLESVDPRETGATLRAEGLEPCIGDRGD